MYFKSRVAAGTLLAEQIVPKYSGQKCTIVALNDGGVMVGSQIALGLNCALTMLMTEKIMLPREDAAVAGMSQDGSFSFNQKYSQGEIDEFVSEYYHFIEQEKMNKLQKMHHLAGREKLIRKSLLQDHIVILVSDGLPDGFAIDIALQFLKPIHTQKLVIATPFASVAAVDRMHVLGDDLFCLNVLEDYISTDHYYEVQDIPPHEKVVKTVEHIVANWK